MEIIKAKTVLQFETIEQLARNIFPEHYGAYLPIEHVNCFIEKYQTAKTIQKQIQNGFEYYLLNDSGKSVAYLGVQEENNKLILRNFIYSANKEEKALAPN